MHDHPNALEFKYRLRSYLLGRNEGIISNAANVEADTEKIDQSFNLNDSMIEKTDGGGHMNDLDSVITSEILQPLTENRNFPSSAYSQEMPDLEYDALEFLGGYILNRMKFKYPEVVQNYIDKDCSNFTWTDQISEGGLQKPNTDFIEKLTELEEIFNEYNGSELKHGQNYIKNLTDLSARINLHIEFKKIYFRCKMFFKMRILNSKTSKNVNGLKRKLNKTIN